MKFKALLFAITIVFIVSILAGCSQVVSRKVTPVEAYIVDADHDQFMKIGAVYRSADYDILVRISSGEHWIDVSRHVYLKYADSIGDVITINHVVEKYDNGYISTYLEFPE